MSRTMKAILGIWIATLLGAASWIGWDSWRGGKLSMSQPAIGGPFALIDQDGRGFTETDLKGKPTLLYFGYTYCPDVCPTSLLLMESAVEMLGPNAAQRVNIVFITIDPERDTPRLLKGFVSAFGPTIIGLTGTSSQVDAVAHSYAVYYQKVPGRDGGPYLMDHSSIIYLLDQKGRTVRYFSHETTAEAIAKALSKIL